MHLFRNEEAVRFTVFYILAGGGFSLAGWFFISGAAGLLLMAACAVFYVVWLCHARYRYRKMSDLAAGIDKMLHSGEMADLSSFREGELSLLKDELSKLMIRLGEQNEQLKKDKIRMADSIADISHQIRTPLTTANLLLASLKKEQALTAEKFGSASETKPGSRKETDSAPERRREATERQNRIRLQLLELSRLLARMEWLIQSLLKMAKLDVGAVQFRREELSFETVVKKAMEPLEIPMELKQQEMICRVEGGFCGDLLWTVEAVGNILKNCMEHTPEGGRIYVEGTENPVYSQLVIRDTGPGITKEDLPHLFERFYKGEASPEQSVGIGLALAQSIIHSQNGYIRAGNHPEGGAEFRIRFYKTVV